MFDGRISAPCQAATSANELLVNGKNLRAPIEEHIPAQARALQCITKLARLNGGFRVFGAGPVVRACIQFSSIRDIYSARLHVLQLRNQLIGLVNTMNPILASAGGGCKDIDAQLRGAGEMGAHLEITVIVELPDRSDVHVIDILISKLAPLIEQLTNGTRSRSFISEIADRQLLCAQVSFDPSSFSLAAAPGYALAGRIVELHDFTCMTKDLSNACNAGILATANSMLGAVGAASDSNGGQLNTWKAHNDQEVPLSIWYRDHRGHLAGRISLPVLVEQADAIGAAVDMTSAQAAVASTSRCTHLLNPAVAAVGLAQSLANLHSHAAAAIAQSNPGQHAHDLALLVGARGSEIVHVVKALISAQSISFDRAVAALDKLRGC